MRSFWLVLTQSLCGPVTMPAPAIDTFARTVAASAGPANAPSDRHAVRARVAAAIVARRNDSVMLQSFAPQTPPEASDLKTGSRRRPPGHPSRSRPLSSGSAAQRHLPALQRSVLRPGQADGVVRA